MPSHKSVRPVRGVTVSPNQLIPGLQEPCWLVLWVGLLMPSPRPSVYTLGEASGVPASHQGDLELCAAFSLLLGCPLILLSGFPNISFATSDARPIFCFRRVYILSHSLCYAEAASSKPSSFIDY